MSVEAAKAIQAALPSIKVGTLRFWGEWFGRPYDNWHRILGAESEGDMLRIHFDQGEVLEVWNPRGLEVDSRRFLILDGDRVRWEWHYYGRPQVPENRHFRDFAKSGEEITWTTNVDWYVPHFRPSTKFPAVEIL